MTDEPDDDGMNMLLLRTFGKRPTATAAGRRERENKMLAQPDRRRLRATGRTVQMNLRTTPVFKAELETLAYHAGMTMIEYVERAVAMYAASGEVKK